MGLGQRYENAITVARRDQTGDLELLPMLMAQACVEVLPVDGASLSLTDELRVSLGASDPDAATAERVQVTLGEGPCLSATASVGPVSAGLAELQRRWPVFCQELVSKTPFRSVTSIPLRSQRRRPFGALDLYSTSSEPLDLLLIDAVAAEIGGPIGDILLDPDGHREPDVRWLHTAQATTRMNVWIAVGMVIEHAKLDNRDSLDLLRAYSYSHSQSLDHTARQMLDRELQPSTILA